MHGTISVQDLVSGLSPRDRAELCRQWFDAKPVWSAADRDRPSTGAQPGMEGWLGSLRPDDWHEIVLHFDWDSGPVAVIKWIAQQPNADRATILSILLEQDIRFFEDIRRLRPDENPRAMNPDGAALLDIMARGFAAGHYRTGAFCVSHDANVLPRTRDYLAGLSGSPMWTFPDHVWSPCEGAEHQPDFVWDHMAHCQRIPFDDWLKTRLRPH